MFRISKDSPAFYLTSVTKDRPPIFRTETISRFTCEAIAESRKKHGFLIFAYVIMLDHLHLVTDSKLESTQILRLINGIIGRRILDHLKSSGHVESLEKLRINDRSDGSKYTIWQRHPDVRLVWSEQMLWQRIQYTHLNPVRAGLVDHPNDWPWSSARIWHGKSEEVEPLVVDKKIRYSGGNNARGGRAEPSLNFGRYWPVGQIARPQCQLAKPGMITHGLLRTYLRSHRHHLRRPPRGAAGVWGDGDAGRLR